MSILPQDENAQGMTWGGKVTPPAREGSQRLSRKSRQISSATFQSKTITELV